MLKIVAELFRVASPQHINAQLYLLQMYVASRRTSAFDPQIKKMLESQASCTDTTVPQWMDMYACSMMLQSAFKGNFFLRGSEAPRTLATIPQWMDMMLLSLFIMAKHVLLSVAIKLLFIVIC